MSIRKSSGSCLVFNRKMFAVLMGACAVFLITDPAFAQKGGPAGGGGVGGAAGGWSGSTPPGWLFDPPSSTPITRDNTSGSRLNRQREEERRMEERRRRVERGEMIAPDNPSQAEIMAAAQSVAASAGLDCQVTSASHPGVDAQESPIYEAACTEGQGYVLVASAPPQSIGCFELAGAAAAARLDNPAADVGQQCELPANQNSLPVIGAWAREAGVTCQVDKAVVVGRSTASNLIYEIGCADADGYWLEKADDSWLLQGCAQIVAAGETCRFARSRS